MAVPSEKHPAINNLLNTMSGGDRERDISEGRCVPSPIGCGKPIDGFRDELSRKEFSISGLCQSCQDKFFG